MVGVVGLVTCLDIGLLGLALVVLETVGFGEPTFDSGGLDGETLTEFALDTEGLDGVAFDGVTFILGYVFLVGWCFFGATPWSEKAASDFGLEGLVLVTVGTVVFFLSDVIGFLELLWGVGFSGISFAVLLLEGFDVEGLGVGGFVGGGLILSGAVTVSVLVLVGGVTSRGWTVTGITVPNTGVGRGFIVGVVATSLTAEAAAATLLARLSRGDVLEISRPLCLGEAAVAVMFVSRGRIGSKGERLGLNVSASLHCFLMYLQ